jgi:hypothetical protein
VALFVLFALLWLLVAWGLQRLVSVLRRRADGQR